jgi:hypothetical protein
MKFRLQLFGFDQSAYERPGQKWVCGWAAEGTPCHRGPDAHGNCCGGMACQPKQNGSRWECSRTAAAGGPCAEGPLPDGSCCQAIVTCRPVRSLRARRGLVVAWTLALTAGVLSLGLSHWSHFVSPGPLIGPHAALLAKGAAQGCASCHTAPHNWMNSLDRDRLADSTLCLNCHKNQAQFHSNMALLPHGVPASLLGGSPTSAALMPAMASSVDLTSPGSNPPAGGQIACATCHHEHQGPHENLATMDNQTCQTCHTNKFHSFADGHPEFTRHHESTNEVILFSHASHRDQHFGTEKFECTACHTPASDGRITIASFQSSCARCHSDHFNGKAEPSQSGIVLLQVPALDLQTLKSLKVDIGQWPAYDGDPPVRLTPFMRLLLTNDHADYLAHLPADLGQLSDATDEQILAVQQLAWAVKTLLTGAGKDVNSLQPALAGSMGHDISPAQFADLTAGLHADDVKSAVDHWFPRAATELQKPFAKWDAASRPKKTPPAPAVPAAPAKGGADDLFNDPAPANKPPTPTPASATPAAPAKGGSDDLFNDSGPASKPASPPTAPAVNPPAAVPKPAAASDDLFNDSSAPATKPAVPAPAAAPPAKAKDSDDLFNDSSAPAPKVAAPTTPAAPAAPKAAAGGGDDLFNSDTPAPAVKAPVTPAPPVADTPALAPAPSGPILSPNGWERNDDKYALIYHPIGHANTFLRRWMEIVAPASVVPATPWKTQLVSADIGGACIKCHAPSQAASTFVWSPDAPDLLRRDFVKFSHRPHLLEPALQNCSACHAMPEASDSAASIDPVSGFKFIQKQTCAACHAPTLAGDSCLTCHNYHVTPPAKVAAVMDPLTPISSK